jgi:hypothetical protein
MLRLKFIAVPMVKQVTEEVPDPDLESVEDVRITPRPAIETLKNDEEREHRGCCVQCGKGKCDLM